MLCAATLLPRHVRAHPDLDLLVYENPDAAAPDAYGSRVWPAANFLASLLASEPTGSLAGLRTLELGCGNGLCSLAAARLGALHVCATDHVAPPLALVDRAAEAQAVALETAVFDFAAPMPGAAIVASRSRARRIPPVDRPLPPHDLLLAADVGYDPGLAWRLGERARESLACGGRVLIAESRQMPACRSAFSEALNLGRAHDAPRIKLRAAGTQRVEASAADEALGTVAVGGGGSYEGERGDATVWLLDITGPLT